MERQIRKAKDNILLCGKVGVTFGLWNLAAIILYNLFASDYIPVMFGLDTSKPYTVMIANIIWAVLAVIILLMRLYVRRCTIRECTSGCGNAYIVIAVLSVIISFSSLVSEIIAVLTGSSGMYSAVTGMISDIVVTLNMSTLIYYGLQLKKLRRAAGEEADADAD